MTPEENTSNFNGLNLEIRGKILIEHSYSASNNQHHIVIGIPQLDHAETQVKCSQYDSDGNSVKEIDLTAYKSIEIVEFSQQPTTTQQSDDSINMEHALSRNQQRLSDFYQAYKKEDSSIDWSKVGTKITLPSTSGKFYNHDNKRTVGFKIELSPEAVQRIDIRDGESAIASFFHSDQVSTRLHIDNLCRLEDKEVEPPPNTNTTASFCSPYTNTTASFCSPFTITTSPNPPVDSTTTITYKYNVQYPQSNQFCWYICEACGVLYDNNSNLTHCFANNSGVGPHSPAIGNNGDYFLFGLPYTTNPPSAVSGCGYCCSQCQSLFFPRAPNLYCPKGGNHQKSTDNTVYWAISDEPAGVAESGISGSATFNMCTQCAGLYYPTGGLIGIKNACYQNSSHTPSLSGGTAHPYEVSYDPSQ